MNEQQQQLYGHLFITEPTQAAKERFIRNCEQFVLDYGWWYDPAPSPDGIKIGTPRQCHKNAHDVAMEHDGLIYCERFALFKNGGTPTLHAWVTDGEGRAFDKTWKRSGVAYAGVPFKGLFVTMTNLKNRATISLIDDWQNDYPLRGELGERPDEWYEESRKGTAKL